TLNAARVLVAASTLLRISHDEVAALALASSPGANGITLVPYFEGERTPNLPDATARLEGMTLANASAETVARAFVEGMLCGLADGLDADQSQGLDPRRLLLSAGAARTPAARADPRDISPVPLDVPQQAPGTCGKALRQYPEALAPSVDEISLDIADGEFLVLVGPSGCGKSTTLRMLAGLEPVDAGRIRIGEDDVTQLSPRERDIAMVF